MVYPVNTDDFQFQAVHRVNKQHLQLGLRKGMAVLVYYRVQWGPHAEEVFQAVLIAYESATNRGKKSDNKLWKRVVPSETEFAWLPPEIAWAFCSDALCRRRDCQYLAFNEAHMGLQGRSFQANIFLVDMGFLGDTVCTSTLLLGSPKNISTPCYLTGLLDATAKIHMKRKGTGVRILMQLLGIGSNVVVGWRAVQGIC